MKNEATEGRLDRILVQSPSDQIQAIFKGDIYPNGFRFKEELKYHYRIEHCS
jgi:hypothetical protein